ncbi:sushi, von Willebrand factor type A, EGF and pentraxin domain-containing protein 1-like [Mercenaria mercenaria]|uniref:sushi, von Willebrand factor type A, EGF and pentraxin domain-containing protein 1-like n=1 Tax=Mercenaria mercenaria TaxID=6596 RepID=UPI00234ECE63|nr:sushi, von Willebrand factor type A, EGF and pentraxin domain-containing protein 1-like [Mercenaria mercenaria]
MSASVKCPAGYYQRHIQHIKWHWRGISQCTECPVHMFCDIEQLSGPAGFCEDGYYCEKGEQQPKPSGTICGPGEYCVKGRKFLCEKGFYQPYGGRHECFECPEGMYCVTEGLAAPSGNCDMGFYCGKREIESSPATQKCPAGYMCPNAEQTICSKGYYQPLEYQTRCLPCPLGKYCQDTGLSSPSGDCDPGCCLDIAQINASSCPPASPTTCTQGFYYDQSAGRCELCPEGMYCAISGLTDPSGSCETGWYCEIGEITPMPLGKLCPAGHQCPTGVKVPCSSWVRDSEPYVGHTQYLYQPERGQTSCIECPNRYNCTEQGLTIAENYCRPGYWCFFGLILDCEIGHYCVNGEMFPCRNGFKSLATNQESCVRCSDGELCEDGQVLPCPANMVCYHGIAEFCQLGNECSFVDGAYELTLCDLSNERYDVSQTGCGPCREFRYCLKGNSYECFRNHIGDLCLQNNHYKPEMIISQPGTHYTLTYESQDTNRGYDIKQCEPGTYQNTTFKPSCELCPGGMYCTVNRIQPDGYCRAGYYCPKGSKSETEIECPAGFYCPARSEIPIHCPRGRFQPNSGQGSCYACTRRYYCATPGLTAVTAVCPSGHGCGSGVADPSPCGKGRYNPYTGKLNCSPCVPGTYCPGLTTGWPNHCPHGYKCPGYGTVTPTPCPQGTYQPSARQGYCRNCTSGYYCPTTALRYQEICPSGSKCPDSGGGGI